MEWFIIFGLIYMFACAMWANDIAEKKGRKENTWFILGLLFGLIGVLIAAMAAPAAEPQATAAPQPNAAPQETAATPPPVVPQFAPGWYQDPEGSGGLRWFDGQRWTDQTATPQLAAAAN